MSRTIATLLEDYQTTSAAYHLAAQGGTRDANKEYRAFSKAQFALFAAQPETPAEAAKVMEVALAALALDLTAGGPLPDAVEASLGACLRVFSAAHAPASEQTKRDDGLVDGFDRHLRQVCSLLYVVTSATEQGAIDGGVDEAWHTLGVVQDLAHECLDDWQARVCELAERGLQVEQEKAGRAQP